MNTSVDILRTFSPSADRFWTPFKREIQTVKNPSTQAKVWIGGLSTHGKTEIAALLHQKIAEDPEIATATIRKYHEDEGYHYPKDASGWRLLYAEYGLVNNRCMEHGLVWSPRGQQTPPEYANVNKVLAGYTELAHKHIRGRQIAITEAPMATGHIANDGSVVGVPRIDIEWGRVLAANQPLFWAILVLSQRRQVDFVRAYQKQILSVPVEQIPDVNQVFGILDTRDPREIRQSCEQDADALIYNQQEEALAESVHHHLATLGRSGKWRTVEDLRQDKRGFEKALAGDNGYYRWWLDKQLFMGEPKRRSLALRGPRVVHQAFVFQSRFVKGARMGQGRDALELCAIPDLLEAKARVEDDRVLKADLKDLFNRAAYSFPT